jgi:hypothetical protein
MPKPWFWLTAERRRQPLRGTAAAAILLIGVAGGARTLAAATILQKSVDVELRGDGTVVEHTHLEVRLDSATDVPGWSTFAVPFDAANSQIDSFSAWVREASGRTMKVGREGFDTQSTGASFELQTSRQVRVAHFPGAAPGAVVGVDYQVSERPYFPGGRVILGGGLAVTHLNVRVHGAAAGWRWRIAGRTPALQVAEAAGEVTVTAADLPAAPEVDLAPLEVRRQPALLYGWGETTTWADVGRWYDGITRDLPHGRDAVRQEARALLAGGAAGAGSGDDGAAKRRRLESILAFLRRDVRYVAVEVGIGGYRPAPPLDTFERRWGDCKGKAALLLDLLAEAGIEGYPALINLASRDRIDPDFPTAYGFNHMIAALPVAGLATLPGDPVAGGYLFVDPTLEHGGIGWLHPAEQDQMALVLHGAQSRLVRTPLLADLESERLDLDLAVRPDGSAAGRLRFDLRGAAGEAQIARLTSERPEILEAEARRQIAAWLPAATITAPHWTSDAAAAIPQATLTAEVTVPALVVAAAALADPGSAGAGAGAGAVGGGTGGAGAAGAAGGAAAAPVRWLALASLLRTPTPGLLRDREVPVVLRPQVAETRWRLTLPPGWCPDQSDASQATQPVAAFSQSLRCANGTLEVVRHTELRQRWIDPTQFAALTEIALAEHRAAARRLRLDRLHG